MELQLGLALPTVPKSFDLNFEEKEMANFDGKEEGDSETAPFGNMKKEEESRRTMALFVWSGQPNKEDDRCQRKMTCSLTNAKKEEEEEEVVGWPPIKTWRKNFFHQHCYDQQVEGINEGNMEAAQENIVRNGRSMFVKVKMQGVAIARKIDVSLYHSYQPLINSLIHMFSKYQNCKEDGECYTLTYQDMEGDWMLVGDVPWETFLRSVRRLEILRSYG